MPLWLIPVIYAFASFLAGITLPRLEQAYFPHASGISIASAQAFLAAVASGMITLTGRVDSREEKRRAEDIAEALNKVVSASRQRKLEAGDA